MPIISSNYFHCVLHITVDVGGSEPISPLMDRRAVDEAESLKILRATLIAAVCLSQPDS